MRDITKEELCQLYCIEKFSINKIAKLFKRSSKYISDSLKRFNIEKNPEFNDNAKHEAVKNINIEEFSRCYHEGKTFKELAEIFSCTERQLKRLRTNLGLTRSSKEMGSFISRNVEKKYGVKTVRQIKEFNEKAIQTYKDRAGYDNPSLNPEVQKKRTATNIERYGTENVGQNEEIKKKIKKNMLEKYGVENISQLYTNGRKISETKLNDAAKEVLYDKEKFREYIENLPKDERNYTSISEKLHVADTTITKYIEDYKLESIIISKKATSSYENEIKEYLASLGITNIITNSKKILNNGLEIDLYMPDLKVGIEFNGDYWHTEEKKKHLYHQEKALLAESQGIFLYQIFEYEWTTKKEKIKEHLKHILCKSERVIYARKTKILEISKIDKKNFLNTYHLQGSDNSVYDYGLFLDDELLMVMTFCKARFTRGCQWELSRMCVKSGVSVIGGASKLFNYFVNNILKENEKVVTYNDIAKTRGGVYQRLGFEFQKISKPSYVWWKSHKPVISRYKTQIKNEIKEMHEKGYLRIFDAGNKVWIYTKH